MQFSKGIKYVIALLCTLTVVIFLFLYWGNGKRVSFCDEVYTYNIVNSDSITHYNVNSWMSGEEFNAALTHGTDNYYEQMIVNIKSDKVHPPLYYILFYISSKLSGEKLSVWTGLYVNLAAFVGTAIIVFLTFKKLFDNPVLSALGTVGILWTQCMISDAMLIRMYMVYTFFTVLFTYANMLIADKNKRASSVQGRIGAVLKYFLLCFSIVGGFLTQYYFLFFVAGFFAFEIIYDIKEKKYWGILKYAVAVAAAALIINKLWDYWYVAITSNAHSAGVFGNARELLSHLGRICDGYKLVMQYVFQRAYRVFMVLVPIVVIIFFTIVKKEEHRLIRSFTARLCGVALMYAFIVNMLTPDYLSSTRYYYADMILVLLLWIICVLAIADKLIKVDSGKKSLAVEATGVALIFLNVILLATGFGIDYYPDTDKYDSTTEILESYRDIPWIIGWDNSWTIDSAMFDYTMPDRIMPVNINGLVEKGAFDGVDEFILAQCNMDDSELITQKNLFNYTNSVNKEVEVEKIASRGYVSYYYCRAVDDDGSRLAEVNAFIHDNKDTLWIVINNDGWYDADSIFTDGEPKNIIFIDTQTAYDTTGKYAEYENVAMLTSVYGDDVKDIGLYYMIGSTGKFFGSEYIGAVANREVLVYQCKVVE